MCVTMVSSMKVDLAELRPQPEKDNVIIITIGKR